jgi:hypothetical protein
MIISHRAGPIQPSLSAAAAAAAAATRGFNKEHPHTAIAFDVDDFLVVRISQECDDDVISLAQDVLFVFSRYTAARLGPE